MSKILGLIPARGGSKGVPRKNIRKLNGKPLLAYTIETALQSRLINRTIVSTDDQEVASIARQYRAEVPFMRPSELSMDSVSDFPVIEHAVSWCDNQGWKVDYLVYLRPTCIFRTSEDIDNAIDKIIDSDFDAVRGISNAVYPPYWMKRIKDGRLVSFIETGHEFTRRQDLPEVYQGNGTVDVIRRKTIVEKKSMYGDNTGFIKMDDIAAIDIDTETDFIIAETLYSRWKGCPDGS